MAIVGYRAVPDIVSSASGSQNNDTFKDFSFFSFFFLIPRRAVVGFFLSPEFSICTISDQTHFF